MFVHENWLILHVKFVISGVIIFIFQLVFGVNLLCILVVRLDTVDLYYAVYVKKLIIYK